MLLFEKDLFVEKVDYMEIFHLLCSMGNNISSEYIYSLMCEKSNKIVLYSIENTNIDIRNCPCSLIYSIEKSETNHLYICIQFIATKYSCRKVGYASLFIREFIEYISQKYLLSKVNDKIYEKQITILLDSVMEAVTFYEYIGFRWVINEEYRKLLNIPENDSIEHFIMIYDIS